VLDVEGCRGGILIGGGGGGGLAGVGILIMPLVFIDGIHHLKICGA